MMIERQLRSNCQSSVSLNQITQVHTSSHTKQCEVATDHNLMMPHTIHTYSCHLSTPLLPLFHTWCCFAPPHSLSGWGHITFTAPHAPTPLSSYSSPVLSLHCSPVIQTGRCRRIACTAWSGVVRCTTRHSHV